MSYRLRLLPAVSHPGHNFTGDSRGARFIRRGSRIESEGKAEENFGLSFALPQNELFTGFENRSRF